MAVTKVVILLAVAPVVCLGMDRLSAIAMIESGGNDLAVGKAGEISRYQIRRAEWRSVTNSTSYSNPSAARAVASQLLDRRVRAFERKFHRPPTHDEVYALWNAPARAMSRRLTRTLAERCQRFALLCETTVRPAARSQ